MIVPEEDKDEKGRGYVDSLLRVSLHLLRHGFVPQVRLQGLNLMLHLLRFRWDELRIEDWRSSSFSDDAGLIAGLYDTSDILPSKSDVAALMTEVSLSGGISLLNGFLLSIMFLSERGPTEAELAAFILKSISDSRIDCGVNPDGGQFEVILSDLDEVLPTIMLILSSLLEKYGGQGLAEQPDQLIVSSKNHALTVITCLFAANAYAKWVPVVHLDKYGLIERCKSFLNSSNICVVALQFFRILCQRRRPLFAADDYDNAMNLVFRILMNISKDSLAELEIHHGFFGEKQLIFAGRICECLVTLGSLNMQFIIADGNRATHFFQQMLKYYQHSKFALHFRSLQFWLMVLKESYVACDPGVIASGVNSATMASTAKGNSGALVFVSDDILTEIMDFSLKRIPKKSAATSPEFFELWSDELQGKNGFVQYHTILLDLIRTIAYKRPVIAVSRTVQGINCIIEDANTVSKHPKDLAAVESVQLGLETVLNAIFNDSLKIIPDTEFALLGKYKIFEGLLMQILSLNWTEPRRMVILGCYLNVLYPFLAHFPASVAMVVSKLLEVVSSISVDCHDPSQAPNARLQICLFIIRICQAVDGKYLPSDIKDLFSAANVTVEDALNIGAINRISYSVKQKDEREGNQDRYATQPSSVSYTMPSPPSSNLLRKPPSSRPWAPNGESSGLCVALPSLHDLSTTQPSFFSSSAPSFSESNGSSRILYHKKLDYNLIRGSVPNSSLSLATKSHSRNEGMSLNLSPSYQMNTENCSSSSPYLALDNQSQQLDANVKLLTHVSPAGKDGESQRINIFENCGQGNDLGKNIIHGIADIDFGGFTKSVDEKMLGVPGTVSSHPEKNQLLLMEHNILSETFVTVASFPRIQGSNHLLTNLLHCLNKIWTQPDWEQTYVQHTNQLSRLFANDQFTRIVHSLVKSFEEELTSNRTSAGVEGCSSASSCTLPKLMFTIVLQVLGCIQTLWGKPIDYNLSGVVAEDIRLLLENGNQPKIDETMLLKNAGTWLQGIRDTGYKVIGLCASFDRAFYGLLDLSCIISVLMENTRKMEFNHLGKFILLVIIPLVKHCPLECWDEWMVELLEPVFSYCEDIFYNTWFSFLHWGSPRFPAYFGILNGPNETVIQFEKEILLKFTRSICDLLEVLASERLNSGLSLLPSQSKNSEKAVSQVLKSISSSSLIGFLLHHNCFGRLNMYLFGCLVDHQAANKALPFCYTLIHLAITYNLEWLNQFILNEMLPTVILLLSGIWCSLLEFRSSLNSDTKDVKNDIVCLCQHIYEIYIDNQVIVGERTDKKNISGSFEDWLAKEVADLRKRASCPVPEHFPKDTVWKWEFNEEFEKYLPVYMSMLAEVDGMNDCLKNNYLGCDNLFKKLKPEFKLKYGINNYAHPYLRTMSRMLDRKRPAVYSKNRTIWLSDLLSRLITLKPYIKLTDSWESVMDRLQENCNTPFNPLQCDPASAVRIFLDSILCYWEPQFHPLIRESHKDILKTIACELVSAEEFVELEPLEPHPKDFMAHLQPYAQMYIKKKKEESGYFRFEEQVCMHETFDNYLALGSMDNRMNEFSRSKNEFVHEVVSDANYSQFATLDHDLIKMSFERRAKIVEWDYQISSYSRCLTLLLESDEMENKLRDLMNVLNDEGFFRVDDESIDWDQKLFSDLVDQFRKVVFSGQCIHQCLVLRGIMDYQTILKTKNVKWQDAYRMVVSNTIYSWKENLQEFWVATRHYKHEYYEMLSQPLQKVFLSGGASKPKYG